MIIPVIKDIMFNIIFDYNNKLIIFFIINTEDIYYIYIIQKTIKLFEIYVIKYKGTEYRTRTNKKAIVMLQRDRYKLIDKVY